MKLSLFVFFAFAVTSTVARAADFETWTLESHLQISACKQSQGNDVCHLAGGDPGNISIPLSECYTNPGGSSDCVGYHEFDEAADGVSFHAKITALKMANQNGTVFRLLMAQVGPSKDPHPANLTLKLNDSGKIADGVMLDGPAVRPAPGIQYAPTLYVGPAQ